MAEIDYLKRKFLNIYQIIILCGFLITSTATLMTFFVTHKIQTSDFQNEIKLINLKLEEQNKTDSKLYDRITKTTGRNADNIKILKNNLIRKYEN